MFPQARELLKMGAKPFIPATLKYKSRRIDDFLKEIVDVTIESEDLKRICWDYAETKIVKIWRLIINHNLLLINFYLFVSLLVSSGIIVKRSPTNP